MSERDDAWKNVVGGAIGGLAGSWAMNQFMALQHKAVEKAREASKNRGERAVEAGREAIAGNEPSARQHEPQQQGEPATTKLANVVSEKVFRRKLDERQKKVAEPVVHYTFGALMGAWYGVLAELMPLTTAGMGTFYGAAVWLGADEIAVPALKLSGSPFEYPLSQHASALAAHAVYGLCTDLVRRGFVKATGGDFGREERDRHRQYRRIRSRIHAA